MDLQLQNILILLAGLFVLGMGVFFFINRLKPIIFPKDMPAPNREENRRIAFRGTHNFRDLGGYATDDHRTVKWGVLYRSDHLHRMTNRDLLHLSALGLHRVIDFRADFERASKPNRLPANALFKVVELSVFDSQPNQLGQQEIRRRIMAGKVDGIDPKAQLTGIAVQFVTSFTPQFQAFVHEVLAAQGKPVLFHCTAGKDRTGFASAILLRILGVSQHIIMQDYLLSQPYALEAYARDIFLLRMIKGPKIAGIVEQFSGVDNAYLEAAFEAINLHYGSFDAYIRTGLALSDANISMLRSALLE